MQLLTISGSLRAGSSNATLLAAAAMLVPPHVRVSGFGGMADIPAFNPDIEEREELTPEPVREWRNALAAADGILFSCPEYAHGIPGAFKNALDWVVGSGELVAKPVGLLSASSASIYAHPQIVEVLIVMSALLIPEATIVIDIPRRGATAEQIANDPTISRQLRAVVESLVAAAAETRLA